ncbi:unnamed protein product [Blepharisma stoltei]|uniref:Uncharacterized protein n=1 Tax=Blepharisma stoltei TaxID=1481888 RepID=A0AAU9IKY2_9CILI|nr:unnamed protein product [Blepharisma stoltei]
MIFTLPNQAEMSAKLDLKESLKRNLNENPFWEIPTMARDLLSSVPKKIKLSQETKANLPSQRSIEAALYRERELSVLELPNSLAELVLEGKYRMTNDNLEFLLIEDGIEDKILCLWNYFRASKAMWMRCRVYEWNFSQCT